LPKSSDNLKGVLFLPAASRFYYASEMRWPEAPFWQRRHRQYAAAGSMIRLLMKQNLANRERSFPHFGTGFFLKGFVQVAAWALIELIRPLCRSRWRTGGRIRWQTRYAKVRIDLLRYKVPNEFLDAVQAHDFISKYRYNLCAATKWTVPVRLIWPHCLWPESSAQPWLKMLALPSWRCEWIRSTMTPVTPRNEMTESNLGNRCPY